MDVILIFCQTHAHKPKIKFKFEKWINEVKSI